MYNLINKLLNVKDDETTLDWHEMDFYSHPTERIRDALKLIPIQITTLNLAWNYSEFKSTDELKTIFATIPKQIQDIDLSGQSLHLRDKTEWFALFSCFSPTTTVRTGHTELDNFIREIQKPQSSILPPPLAPIEPIPVPETLSTNQQTEKVEQSDSLSLREIMESPDKIKLTPTQLIELLVELVTRIDSAPKDQVIYPTLESVCIKNPAQIGEESSLIFEVDKSAQISVQNLAPGVKRHIEHWRTLAELFLLLGANTTRLDDPDLEFKINQSFKRSPAFLCVFIELWGATQPEKQHTADTSILDLSPTIKVLTNIRMLPPQTWSIEHLPGLLSALTCHHNKTMRTLSIQALYNFMRETITSKSTKECDEALGIIEHCIELIIPNELTGLANISLETVQGEWMQRMLLICMILREAERVKNYEKLHQLQQRLLEAGIEHNLIDALLERSKNNISNPIFLISLTTTIWMCFQFDTLRTKLINEEFTESMISQLNKRGYGKNSVYEEMSIMMLLMSDFGQWINHQDEGSKKFETLWRKVDDEAFLHFGLSCLPTNISRNTRMFVAQKVVEILTRLISIPGVINQEEREQQIKRCLDYLRYSAWNGHAQATHASNKSLEDTYLQAFIFKVPQYPVFKQTTKQHEPSLPQTTQALFEHIIQLKSPTHTPVERLQFNAPLKKQDVLALLSAYKDDTLQSRYKVQSARAGAPLNLKLFYLNLPNNKTIVNINENTDELRTLSSVELSLKELSFVPATLSATQRICTVVDRGAYAGTQGSYQLHLISAGDSNKLLFGITWDKKQTNEHTIPGTTTTSVALDAATGNIQYRDPVSGKQKNYPYTQPINTGATVKICITGELIYFVVNDKFYPPLRDILLPLDADVHPLVRLECPGIHIKTQVMGSNWPYNSDNETLIRHASINPIAYALHFAELRSNPICPHTHAQKNDLLFAMPNLEVLLHYSKQISALPQEEILSILLIVLAKKSCDGKDCFASKLMHELGQELLTKPPGYRRLSEIAMALGLRTLSMELLNQQSIMMGESTKVGYSANKNLLFSAQPEEPTSKAAPSSSLTP
ncbi:MAG: hypothetical protein P4L79_04165 [Legionella sp.]|uniref:hypothetical protein n=1 Tax=Legionella sp. TaxID=459 RepID=UPI00284015F0|nr:hypothetical protein [Legionella sp.]